MIRLEGNIYIDRSVECNGDLAYLYKEYGSWPIDNTVVHLDKAYDSNDHTVDEAPDTINIKEVIEAHEIHIRTTLSWVMIVLGMGIIILSMATYFIWGRVPTIAVVASILMGFADPVASIWLGCGQCTTLDSIRAYIIHRINPTDYPGHLVHSSPIYRIYHRFGRYVVIPTGDPNLGNCGNIRRFRFGNRDFVISDIPTCVVSRGFNPYTFFALPGASGEMSKGMSGGSGY